MRAGSVSLLSLAAQMVSAQVIITTKNECFKGEGGKFVDNCSDVYFLTCDNYIVEKNESCNVFVFSDSRVTWIPEDITVNYWAYYFQPGQNDEQAVTSADFAEKRADEGKCKPGEDIPKVYKMGKVMNYTDGMCGYKYQITNADKNYENKFKVLKDRSTTLLASSIALALTSMLVF